MERCVRNALFLANPVCFKPEWEARVADMNGQDYSRYSSIRKISASRMIAWNINTHLTNQVYLHHFMASQVKKSDRSIKPKFTSSLQHLENCIIICLADHTAFWSILIGFSSNSGSQIMPYRYVSHASFRGHGTVVTAQHDTRKSETSYATWDCTLFSSGKKKRNTTIYDGLHRIPRMPFQMSTLCSVI
jgi:hypothetical protein